MRRELEESVRAIETMLASLKEASSTAGLPTASDERRGARQVGAGGGGGLGLRVPRDVCAPRPDLASAVALRQGTIAPHGDEDRRRPLDGHREGARARHRVVRPRRPADRLAEPLAEPGCPRASAERTRLRTAPPGRAAMADCGGGGQTWGGDGSQEPLRRSSALLPAARAGGRWIGLGRSDSTSVPADGDADADVGATVSVSDVQTLLEVMREVLALVARHGAAAAAHGLPAYGEGLKWA